MEHSERLEIFEKVRAEYSVFLLSVLWKLTGDKELFTEAMQYALMGIWRHVEKLDGKKAGAYIYRIALTANSRAWRNRIGKNGDFAKHRVDVDKDPGDKMHRAELAAKVRRTCLAKHFSFCSDTSDNISSDYIQSTLWMIVQEQL